MPDPERPITPTSRGFVRNSALFFGGSLLIAFLNYLYHPLLSRLLSPEDFGETQALVSVFLQLSAAFTVFGYIVTNRASQDEASDVAARYLSALRNASLWLSALLAVGLVIASPWIMERLRFHSTGSLVALALLIPLNVALTVYTAYLQGVRDFVGTLLSGIAVSAGRLLFSCLLVYLGWRSGGAIVGILVAHLLTLAYIAPKTGGAFAAALPFKQSLDLLRPEIPYAVFVFLTLAAANSLSLGDAVLAKAYFSPEVSGYYGGVATVGRIVFFAASPIAGVLLPSITRSAPAREQLRLLGQALGLVLLIGGGCLLLFSLAPSLIIRLLLGREFAAYSSLLPRIGGFLLMASLSTTVLTYAIALRRYRAVLAPLLGIGLLYLLIPYRHATLGALADDFLIANSLTLLLALALAAYPGAAERRHA